MITGFSLSPGGLLFPYHIGVLQGLSHHSYLTEENPLAGSSAGAIAVTSHAANKSPYDAIDATTRISDKCAMLGSARGNLLKFLEKELDDLLDEDVHEMFNEREGFVGLAYQEIFPRNKSFLDVEFDSKEHVIDSVLSSSMFPFFSTNWPCRFARKSNNEFIPRLTMDGFFTVPRDRFGCPDFDMALSNLNESGRQNDDLEKRYKVDRTITVSVFPHDMISLTASKECDQISPVIENPDETTDQITRLFRLATETASHEEYNQLYEDGWKDAEKWIRDEEQRGYWGLNSKDRRKKIAEAQEEKELPRAPSEDSD